MFLGRILELNLFDNIVGDLYTVLLDVLEDPDGNISRGPDDEQVILFNGSRNLFLLKAEPRFDQIFLIQFEDHAFPLRTWFSIRLWHFSGQ